jgi:hypothetical protein
MGSGSSRPCPGASIDARILAWPTIRVPTASPSCKARRDGTGPVSATTAIYSIADDVLLVLVLEVANRRDVYR